MRQTSCFPSFFILEVIQKVNENKMTWFCFYYLCCTLVLLGEGLDNGEGKKVVVLGCSIKVAMCWHFLEDHWRPCYSLITWK